MEIGIEIGRYQETPLMPVIAGAKLREGTTTILPSGRALQGVGLSSMRFHPIGGARTNQGPLGGLSGGLEPCRCSRPARDAAPTITPTIFWSDRLAADAGPGRRRSQLPQIRPDALEAPDFVGTGEETGAPGRAERPSKWWG